MIVTKHAFYYSAAGKKVNTRGPRFGPNRENSAKPCKSPKKPPVFLEISSDAAANPRPCRPPRQNPRSPSAKACRPIRQIQACPPAKPASTGQSDPRPQDSQTRACPAHKPALSQQIKPRRSIRHPRRSIRRTRACPSDTRAHPSDTRVYLSDEILLLLFPPSAIIKASTGFSEVWYRAWFGSV